MLNALKNIFILVGLLLTAGLGYYLYTNQNGMNLQTNDQDFSIEAESAALISKINSIKRITIDQELFNDPRFRNLRSFATPIPVYPVGRDNPFEPRQ